jgi:hypothetical protein
MAEPRKLKKCEMLEVRIPYPTKTAFMALCQDEGRSASEAVRGFIDRRLRGEAEEARSRKLVRWLVGGAIAAAAGAMAAPSLAGAGPDAAFRKLDLNHDGVVAVAEVQRLDTDRDGTISLREYRAR